MTIEQRLHHAARELREVRIDVPPLGARPRAARRLRVPVLVAPMLFAIGGLLTIGVVQGGAAHPMQSDIPSAPSAPSATSATSAPSALSAPAAPGARDASAAFVETPTPEPAPASTPAPSDRAELELIAQIVTSNTRPSVSEAEIVDEDPTATLLAIAGPN